VRPDGIESADVGGSFIDYVYLARWAIVPGMRTETIGPDEAAEQRGGVNHGVLVGAELASTGQARQRPREGKFWVPLVWAAVPTLLVSVSVWTRLDQLPEQVVGALLFAVLLPAAVICEKLGFGQFNILGGSTIPDWLFFSVMIALVYLYSLGLVMVGRGVARFARWVSGQRRGVVE
jgi:hypothetical protein